MQINQNTITLNPCNGFYEEYVLIPADGVVDKTGATSNAATIGVLPGTIVGQRAFITAEKYAQWQAEAAGAVEEPVIKWRGCIDTYGPNGNATDVDSVELLVVVENALLGKSINHLAFRGEVTPVYRPVSGDRFLVRAVPGKDYIEGQALYLVPYTSANGKVGGYYFTNDKTAEGAGSEIRAYAAETFSIPATSEAGAAFSPKIFIDEIDDSTTERPSTIKMNGGLVNLLRVRIA